MMEGDSCPDKTCTGEIGGNGYCTTCDKPRWWLPPKPPIKHPLMIAIDGMFEGTFDQFENCFGGCRFYEVEDIDTKLAAVQEWCCADAYRQREPPWQFAVISSVVIV